MIQTHHRKTHWLVCMRHSKTEHPDTEEFKWIFCMVLGEFVKTCHTLKFSFECHSIYSNRIPSQKCLENTDNEYSGWFAQVVWLTCLLHVHGKCKRIAHFYSISLLCWRVGRIANGVLNYIRREALSVSRKKR